METGREYKSKEKLRNIERLLEVAIDRGNEFNDDTELVPAEVRHQTIDSRFATLTSELDGDGVLQKRYSRCMAFISTVASSLEIQYADDLSDSAVDALRRLYRFVSGPVREAAYLIDTDGEMTERIAERLTAELSQIASEIKEADILTHHHTYP